ncbi:putative NADH:ubiquinone oxidoreductase, subunit RnfG [Thioflavicoccus mobilis 8321]|uniref:Ion-translocating oxidoreductase complex subunit G n=1 Tax=Thioflavicoccus mobilis 8321 TaxID=765912 RepID=L0GUX4_9GAMM|nr:FMN-binding protein [Thioflavicoccus mobilis]AGA89104.1 putative NADH:ubiquinone oxidoreductase, subunit RnfG [Thioflavicoccus mobilis 8321]
MSTTMEKQAPPDLREMASIAIGLTLVCLVAAIVLGGVYYLTEPAKVRNIRAREQTTIQELLGLSADARIEEVRRYLSWKGSDLEVLYLTPARLVRVDESGQALDTYTVPEEIAKAQSPDTKDEWVQETAHAPESDDFHYVGRFFVGLQDGQTAGYVVEGVTPGYKTWIRFFLAIDADFGVQGLEIVEHEEDPGLGAEITQRYFKNQFAGRSYEQIETIDVTKDPLPNKWRAALEQLGDVDFAAWVHAQRPLIDSNPDIYAITGSTISSKAVTNGVKRALHNFRTRMSIVENYL